MSSLKRAAARGSLPLGMRLRLFNWPLLLLIFIVAGVGFATLYSAANGSIYPWASRQMVRFGIGLVILFVVALTDLRLWLRAAYGIYGVALLLLVAVEVMGTIGMGARRWIDLGVFLLQPSEVMKIALVLALARYFHGRTVDSIRRPIVLVPPTVMSLLPAALVLRQPDLGTAGMLLMGAAAIFFAAGVRLWKFAVVLGAGLAAVPVAWNFLHDYQKERIFTFLDPESDPLGSGYHIMQSKIALGSGGLVGKGFLQGTQSHLSFLPEKQTDFIFTMFAEEMGLIGALALLGLFALLVIYATGIALRCRNHFGRLLAVGVGSTYFLYVFINIAMVTGLIPVVGVPLPLVSYGGTAMMTVLIGFGLLISVSIHRDVPLRRHPGLDGY